MSRQSQEGFAIGPSVEEPRLLAFTPLALREGSGLRVADLLTSFGL